MSTFLPHVALDEAARSEKLIQKLDSVPLGRMYQASFKAVVRMHLFFTGRTHELFGAFSDKAQRIILRNAVDLGDPASGAGRDKGLDGSAGLVVQSEILKLWGDTFKTWSDEFQTLREQAVAIPFGVMAVFHERLVVPSLESQVSEKRDWRLEISEAVKDGVFSPQFDILLNAAENHLYGDSLNLSQRIWRVDRDARDGINAVLMKGIANGDSAWNIAQELEQYLGASADCPRWTSTRLYGKTKSEIAAGDTGGLMSSPCDGRGVSYNALRLARNEIQKAHALATDKVLMSQPWVEQEQVHLSAAHPEKDICDDVVGGGEQGKGVYGVGEIELPLHVHCLCYKTAVMMDEKEFISQLKGWMNGTQEWSAMDSYAEMIGGDVNQSILPSAINLAVWLFGDNLEKWIK